ncbi:hypothetical protein SBA3_3140008 [Candidatus Sulfopaludibacter sp. SbA3]|nr:hypothetical protein SBA3_3140008 [Candidatus Sulfopaludibacter sp. SbA3]
MVQKPAFGNNRSQPSRLYNGAIGLTMDNAAWDARSFSLTGQDTRKPAYNHAQGVASFGGPVPNRKGANLSLNYQWARNRNATLPSALMPTQSQRDGEISVPVTDPANGAPLPDNAIPLSRISPPPAALLRFYPLPNLTGSTRYNYEVPMLSTANQDSVRRRGPNCGQLPRPGRSGTSAAESRLPQPRPGAAPAQRGCLSRSGLARSHRCGARQVHRGDRARI